MARPYKTTYQDVYKLHAKYERVPPRERDDRYWEAFTREMGTYSRANADPFTTAMLVAVADELEREYINAQNNG